MPVAIAYLSAVLKKQGHSVCFLDMEIENNADKKLLHILNTYKPDYAAFSLQTAGLTSAFNLIENTLNTAKYIKQKLPEIKILAGGMYPTISPQKFLFKGSPIDYAVRGYGEMAFLKILETKDLPLIIEGVSYFDENNNTIIDNGIAKSIEDIDSIPFPDYETVNLKNYPPPPGCFIDLPSYPAFIGRGCIFTCGFCTAKNYNKTLLLRTPKNIVKEMEYVKNKTSFKEIHFMDATFTANKKHTNELCDLIIEKNIGITWHTATRIDCLDKPLIDKLWDSGCRGLGFGIESASPDLLNTVNRHCNIDQTKELLRYISDKGFFIRSSFMYGFPNESKEQMEQTKKLALSLPSDLSYFSMLNLKVMLEKDTKTPLELKYLALEKDNQDTSVLMPKMPYPEIIKFAVRSYLRFYLRPSLLIRFIVRKTNRKVLATLLFKYIPSLISKKFSK